MSKKYHHFTIRPHFKNIIAIQKVKDQNGNYEHVAIRVMEITLRKAYQLLVQEHPKVKIC